MVERSVKVYHGGAVPYHPDKPLRRDAGERAWRVGIRSSADDRGEQQELAGGGSRRVASRIDEASEVAVYDDILRLELSLAEHQP